MAASSIARQCLDVAAAAAPALLGRVLDQAIATLQQQEEQRAADKSQRQDIADAWLELSRRRGEWPLRYASLLEAAHKAPAAAAETRTASGFAALALLDEDTLADEIESARLLQLIAPRLEQPLAELDARMSTALGLEVVQPEHNPLRPQVFTRALLALMRAMQQPAVRKLWVSHLSGPLAGEIAAIYRQASDLLQAANVQAATYRVLPTASAAAVAAPQPTALPASGAPGSPGAPADAHGPSHGDGTGPAAPATAGLTGAASLGGAAWADLSGYELRDELFQHFLFSRGQPSSQPLGSSYYARVDAQIAAVASGNEAFQPFDAQAVQRQRTLSPVERPPRPVGTARELDAVWGHWAGARERSLHRARIKKEARQIGQVLGLEVVRKLVDQVARDTRLLAPVREAMVAVEPALLRLALAAPRFFSQEDHAGRRLVERVAERSFRYNDEFSTEFQEFFTGVRSAFQALNEQEVRDDQPFAQVLDRLEERWAGEDAIDDRGRQVAVDAIHFAEAREAEAARIAWSLSQRSDLEDVPAVVQDFLYGPWSLVMAHARLTDTTRALDPGGWNAVISDLLWSVKPQHTLRDPSRLIATIPDMLQRLRAGIALLGQEPSAHAPFFAALESLHRPVLKLRAMQRRTTMPAKPATPLDPALLSTERQQPSAGAGDPWLTPKELRAAGFDEEPAAAATPAGDGGADADTTSVVADLQLGSWVDLHAHGRWRRASLTWVSSRATLFMFVSNGGRPHSMTRRSLERLVRERLLRPVQAGAVVPRALEALSATSAADLAANATTTRGAPREPQVAA